MVNPVLFTNTGIVNGGIFYSGQFTTHVEANLPRVMRARHGCLTLRVRGQARMVHIAPRILRALQAKICMVDAFRIQLRLSWNEVDGIIMRGF